MRRLLAASSIIMGLISCKKQYSCECVETLIFQGDSTSATAVGLCDKPLTEKEATELCAANDYSTMEANGVTVTQKCTVK